MFSGASDTKAAIFAAALRDSTSGSVVSVLCRRN
jgi:hypothetical protein